MPGLRALRFASLLIAFGVEPLVAAESLLLRGQLPLAASLVSASQDGTLQFEVTGQPRRITAQELIRWSGAPADVKQGELLLSDGSRLALAATWTGVAGWQFVGDSVSVTSKLLGKAELQRSQVRAIVLRAPTGLRQRRQFFDSLQGDNTSSDELRLTNGDLLLGQFTGIVAHGAKQRQISFLLETTREPLYVAEDRIAAIVLRNVQKETPPQPADLVVGLRDGSRLMVASLIADDGQLRIRLAGGVELTGTDASDVIYLRSLRPPCSYLSDIVTHDYQHVPYLAIPWPYRRDRNVLQGPLQVAGGRYDKGLGMHSASRVTFRLDSEELAGRYQRLVATLAIDDAAMQRGSVVFRVYLERDGKWQRAYTSPIVRGGDRPLPVTVELNGAQQLALACDFADRGDERDYANWLEARLE